MRISIGILAWNEADSIGATIGSLFSQSLVTHPPDNVEMIQVVCVPNGCTDSTAEAARQAIRDAKATLGGGHVQTEVHELAEAGKSNAWNHYVHEYADPEADYIYLMDADVLFHEPHTLRKLFDVLEQSPQLKVAAAKLVKDLTYKPRKSFMDRISLAASRMTHDTVHGIAGGLYCARGSTLRSIWLPIGLLGEDGFLKAMIVTNGFTQPDDPSVLTRVDEATLIYEAERRWAGNFRHSRRLAIGSAMNTYLFDYLWKNTGARGAGDLIRENNEHDPAWARKLIHERVSQAGWWVLPRGAAMRRLLRLRSLPLTKAAAYLPICIVGTPFDLAVSFSANARMRKQEMEW
ncbi:MAG: glycosyltransferase family 2 protein [Bacillota bacterium]